MQGGGMRVAMAAGVVACTLLLGQATAEEEHRDVPPTGMSLAYNVVMTTTFKASTGLPPHTAAWNYTYRVSASDGVTASGTIGITTIYAIPACRPGACDAFQREMAQLNARREGQGYAIDIPPAIASGLTKLGAFRWRYFIPELARFALPAMRVDAGRIGFDPAPAAVQSVRLECDKAALASFFPIGRLPSASVSCVQSFERSQARPPTTNIHAPDQQLTLHISYEGPGTVTTRAGAWAVQRIRAVASGLKSSARWENEILFSEKLGAIVKEHSVTGIGSSGASVETDRELIAVSQ